MKRIVQVLLAMFVFLMFFVAYQTVSLIDQQQPYANKGLIYVDQVNVATKADALSILQETAEELDAVLLKAQPSVDNNFSGRNLFAFIGDKQLYDRLYGEGYPDFTPSTFKTSMKQGSDITTEDLRGAYGVSSENSSAQNVVDYLSSQGIDAHVEQSSLIVAAGLAVGETHLAGVIAVIALATVLVLMYNVSQKRKIYAIWQIHGYPKRINILSETLFITRTFIAASVIIFTCGCIYLFISNAFAQFSRFLLVSLALLGGLYIFLLIVGACAVVLFENINLPSVIKGERASRKTGFLAAAIQIGVIVLAVVTANTSLARISSFQEAKDVAEIWNEGNPLYALRLSVTGTREDDERVAPALADIVKELEKDNKVLLSYQDPYADSTSPYEWGSAKSLIVNNAYLQRQSVLREDGVRIEPKNLGENSFILLVPENYSGNVESLLDTYAEQLSSMCRFGASESEAPCNPQGEIITTLSGQRFPTYSGSDIDGRPVEYQRGAIVEDPVIAIVTASSGLFDPLEYLSLASTSDLLFEDAGKLQNLLEQKGIFSSFQGIDNAADTVNRALQRTITAIEMDILSLIFLAIIFVFSNIILALAYCERQKKPLFVRLIHGYSFAHRHWRYIVFIVLSALIGVAVALVIYHAYPLENFIVASMFLALSMLVSLQILHIYERRIRADFIKRG